MKSGPPGGFLRPLGPFLGLLGLSGTLLAASSGAF